MSDERDGEPGPAGPWAPGSGPRSVGPLGAGPGAANPEDEALPSFEQPPLDLSLSPKITDALAQAEASADAEVEARRRTDDPSEGYTARRRRLRRRKKPPVRGAAPVSARRDFGDHTALLEALRALVDRRAHEAVGPFVDAVLALPERPIRAHAVAERLARMDAHLCLALLRGLVIRSATRDIRAQEVLLDLTTTRPLAEALGYRTARRLYELAHRRGVPEVARMFLSPESLAGQQPSEFFWQQDNQAMPDLSLGWRKKLARGRDRDALDRLLFDKNLQVIRLVLDNPRIVERDVVRMAAMRPANPDGLLAIFKHRRWISRYRVKNALAANPYSPIDVALACLPHLLAPDLRWVATTSTLDEVVTKQATELLAMRGLSASTKDVTWHVAEPGQDLSSVEGEQVDLDLDAIAEQLANWTVS